MAQKIAKITQKVKSKEHEYITELTEIERNAEEKRDKVRQTFNSITHLQERISKKSKEVHSNIKNLESKYVQAEKRLQRLQENYRISKQYEAQRLTILREKQKELSNAI